MRHHRIAAIPADGIGPEVIGAGLLTPELGGKCATAEVTRPVCEAVRANKA